MDKMFDLILRFLVLPKHTKHEVSLLTLVQQSILQQVTMIVQHFVSLSLASL